MLSSVRLKYELLSKGAELPLPLEMSTWQQIPFTPDDIVLVFGKYPRDVAVRGVHGSTRKDYATLCFNGETTLLV